MSSVGGRIPGLVRCLAVVGTALALAAAGCSNNGSDEAATATTPTTVARSAPATSAPADSSPGESFALALTTQISDLDSEWTERGREAIPVAQLNAPPTCSSPGLPVPGTRSAGAVAQFSYRLEAGAVEGQLQSTVLVQATAADAGQTRLRLADPAYSSCLEQDAVTFIERAAGAPAQQVTTTPLSLTSTFEGVAVRVVVHYTFAGADKVGYIDYFDHLIGRVESRLRLSRCCLPFDETTEAALIHAIHTRAAASPINS